MKTQGPDIITIKGAPGTGKTRTSKCLASLFPSSVRLEVDTLRSMVVSVNWTDQEEHLQILTLSAKLTHGFLHLGYRPVIVVDTFSGDKLNRYLDDIRNLDVSLVVRSFALITSGDELTKRLEGRTQDEFKDIEISLKLNALVVKHLHADEDLIDTTNTTPIETARGIYNRL